ncbi:terminase [Clostridium perfringens]|uniref:terminase n=1 Tax=Clostridium perfringens TaxID=1502 RepID=UPI0013E3F475|nr:terminase [Clostridium perfringens]MDM0961655.1 terminase [Clostridium perfringens]NGU13974.1 terminase [Clostridium perfringens]NGU48079.1 terminase [Clostridium perfringens]QUD74660.1 terminase [Clostridium perfringens]HAT4274053.1 terminase [Clostridium perfringens]
MIYFDNIEFKDDKLYDLYILKKYLISHYGEEKAIKLITHNDIDEIAKALGNIDIEFFCLYFLQDIFVVKDTNEARTLSKDHYELWQLANKTFIEDLYDKVNIVCPRGFAKTTIFDLAISIWLVCYKKSTFTLLGAKREDDATQFIDSIKGVFNKNKKIISNFGKLIDKKKFKVNASEIEFTNGCYLRAMGSGTSVRGANFKGIRPTVVIADDYQDDKDVLTDEGRQKKYDNWTKQIEKVGDTAVFRNGKKIKQATKIISIGTIIHLDCLISRLSRNKSYYTVLKQAIILKEDQTVDDIFDSELWRECKKLYFDDSLEDSMEAANIFYKKHKKEMQFKVLWPEKWDCFIDLAIPYWENRSTFMSELMNDATSIGEKWFKSILTKTKEEIEEHKFIKTMLCVDPASTTKKKSDFTAMVVGSLATNGFKYMRELVLDKLEFNDYCQKVVDILVMYTDITHIYIEKNTYQGSDVIKIKELISKHPKLRDRSFIWINEMQRKNKDEKISTVIDPINNGQVIFVDNNREFTDLILEFQGQQYTLHDDSADITAECVNRLDAIQVRSRATLSIFNF